MNKNLNEDLDDILDEINKNEILKSIKLFSDINDNMIVNYKIIVYYEEQYDKKKIMIEYENLITFNNNASIIELLEYIYDYFEIKVAKYKNYLNYNYVDILKYIRNVKINDRKIYIYSEYNRLDERNMITKIFRSETIINIINFINKKFNENIDKNYIYLEFEIKLF